MNKKEIIALLLADEAVLSEDQRAQRRELLLEVDILDSDIRDALIKLRKKVMEEYR